MGREKENYIEQLLKERDLERQVIIVHIQETGRKSSLLIVRDASFITFA
jgi:hypothetical protein